MRTTKAFCCLSLTNECEIFALIKKFHFSFLVIVDPPNAPVKLAVDGNTDTTVSLTWKPPSSDGGRAVKGYEIEWKMPTSSK